MKLAAITCTVCQSPDVIAVEPGIEAPRFHDLFVIVREVAPKAWCADCWMPRFGADLFSMPDTRVSP